MPRSDELSGWKAIAEYLGCGLRTAQEMEKGRGLPVYHQPGPRGRVFAYPKDLDAWRSNGQPITAVETAPPESKDTQIKPAARVNRRHWLRYALAAGSVLGAAGLGFWTKIRVPQGPPTAFRVEGATLIVSGKDNVELWRHTFPMQLRSGFYNSDQGPLKRCAFADLDKDGTVETLFCRAPDEVYGITTLVCFSSSGKALWEFVPGKEITDNAGRKFAPPYGPTFEVVSSSSGHAQVLVSSLHHLSFPTQVALLDGKTGTMISEYWHRGHLRHLAVADLDGDGEPEVLLGGVNDAPEYKQATVVIFDHRRIFGASKDPHGIPYFRGLPRGSEKKILFFPRTPVSQMEEFNRVSALRVSNGRIAVTIGEGISESNPTITYEFDYSLKLTNALFSGQLVQRYRELQAAGKLPKGDLDFYALAQELGAQVRVI